MFAKIVNNHDKYGNVFIRIKFMRKPENRDEVENYLKHVEKVYQYCQEHNKVFCIFYDTVLMKGVDKAFTDQQIKFMRKYDQLTEKYMKRCCILLGNKALKIILNCIFSAKPSACKDLKTFDRNHVLQAYFYFYKGERAYKSMSEQEIRMQIESEKKDLFQTH